MISGCEQHNSIVIFPGYRMANQLRLSLGRTKSYARSLLLFAYVSKLNETNRVVQRSLVSTRFDWFYDSGCFPLMLFLNMIVEEFCLKQSLMRLLFLT